MVEATEKANDKSRSNVYKLTKTFLNNVNRFIPLFVPSGNILSREDYTFPSDICAVCAAIDFNTPIIQCSNCCESFHLSCLDLNVDEKGKKSVAHLNHSSQTNLPFPSIYKCLMFDNHVNFPSSNERSKAKYYMNKVLGNGYDKEDGYAYMEKEMLSKIIDEKSKEAFGPTGLKSLQHNSLFNGWKCLNCIVCEVCLQPEPENELLVCDKCDHGYHAKCLKTPLSRIPSGTWLCDYCVKCTNCGAIDPCGIFWSGKIFDSSSFRSTLGKTQLQKALYLAI
jgi:hypothetical protein